MPTPIASHEPRFASDAFPATSFMPPTGRRDGISDLERVAGLLEHAIQHLATQQLHEHKSSPRAHAEAIILLCRALNELACVERRKPARMWISTWLRHAGLLWGFKQL